MSDDARTDDHLGEAEQMLRDGTRAAGQDPRSKAVVAELDRLRAELARHRVAGDELAVGVRALLAARGGPTAALAYSRLDKLDAAWRSVRGDAPAAPAATANSALGVAPTAAPTDGQAPADEPRPVRYLSSPCANCEHTYNHHASTGACESCLCQRFRDLPPLTRDRAPAPPLAPQWAPADDTAAPDSPPTTITVPLPAAEHDIDGEDTHGRWTQNPAWETRGIEFGVISAWAQGVCIEDVLHDEGNVIELEETARKVLAAIEWHRHYARLLAAESAGQPVRDSQDGGA